MAYYSKCTDSQEQFVNLFVATTPEYKLHLNAHDVIKLDMTHILPHADGFSDIGPAASRELLRELRAAWSEAGGCGNENGESPAAPFRCLENIAREKGSGFVFVIDEWDCIMREAREDTSAQAAYLNFLRDLLKGLVLRGRPWWWS